MESSFVETREHRRFVEFLDACRRDRYIGLCYGPPGVGKTLSARRYANWDQVEAYSRRPLETPDGIEDPWRGREARVVFYTPPVLNTPGAIDREIADWRRCLRGIASRHASAEEEAMVATAEHHLDEVIGTRDGHRWYNPKDTAAYIRASEAVRTAWDRRRHRLAAIPDPTELVVIDEADRLKVASLEQLRDVFDRSGLGMVLIGMPGIQKRLARYPQLSSRVGFVHEFRPLAAPEVRQLLSADASPLGVRLPAGGVCDEDAQAAVVRITGGNLRLIHRLLTQVARVLEINRLNRVTKAVVEVAREGLVIGDD